MHCLEVFSTMDTKTLEKNNARWGRKGDPRMNRAVQLRLANPSLSLFLALKRGGFEYPTDDDPSAMDEDHVTLSQRKNQLSRRLRIVKNQKAHEKNGNGKHGNSSPRGVPRENYTSAPAVRAETIAARDHERVSPEDQCELGMNAFWGGTPADAGSSVVTPTEYESVSMKQPDVFSFLSANMVQNFVNTSEADGRGNKLPQFFPLSMTPVPAAVEQEFPQPAVPKETDEPPAINGVLQHGRVIEACLYDNQQGSAETTAYKQRCCRKRPASNLQQHLLEEQKMPPRDLEDCPVNSMQNSQPNNDLSMGIADFDIMGSSMDTFFDNVKISVKAHLEHESQQRGKRLAKLHPFYNPNLILPVPRRSSSSSSKTSSK